MNETQQSRLQDAQERTALDQVAAEMRRKIERLTGEMSYLSDEVIPALKGECERLTAENERLWDAINAVAHWKDEENEWDGRDQFRAIRQMALDMCLNQQQLSDPDEGLPTADDVRGILNGGDNGLERSAR